MPEIVFATNNPHKLEEARSILAPYGYTVLSLADIGCHDDIDETADTLDGNARIKALHVKSRYGYDCFADDTGLEVDALGGEPGVYSARYAGPGHDSAANMALLLERMAGKTDRRARFRTAIALTRGDRTDMAQGVVEGFIAEAPRGEAGFGYDPVFVPEGSALTFAQMGADAKNAISHRARALEGLRALLASD